MTGQKTTTLSTSLDVKPTAYEISKGVIGDGSTAEVPLHAWQPMGVIETLQGADNAIRKWCEQQGDEFTGGTLRAIPTSRITERDVKVETRRQLTLGAP